MKKLTLVLVSCVLSGAAHAADQKLGYFELWAGASDFEPKIPTYSGTLKGYTFSNAQATLKYGNPTTYGLEIGMTQFPGTPFRAGLFFLSTKANLKEATGSGTVTDGMTTIDFSPRVTASALREFGLNFDNTADIYGVNAYYDFKTQSPVTPFVGLGIGRADIKNAQKNEFAAALHLGLNVALTKTAYLGARISGYRINGPTDTVGLKYEDITVRNYGLQLGFHY